MNDSHDTELRAAFKALNSDNVSSVTSFATMTSGAARVAARRRQQRRQVGIVAAMIIPALFVMRSSTSDEPDFTRFRALTGIDPAEVTWRAPSDVLLGVPGSELLRRVPLVEIQTQPVPRFPAHPLDSNATKGRTSS